MKKIIALLLTFGLAVASVFAGETTITGKDGVEYTYYWPDEPTIWTIGEVLQNYNDYDEYVHELASDYNNVDFTKGITTNLSLYEEEDTLVMSLVESYGLCEVVYVKFVTLNDGNTLKIIRGNRYFKTTSGTRYVRYTIACTYVLEEQ